MNHFQKKGVFQQSQFVLDKPLHGHDVLLSDCSPYLYIFKISIWHTILMQSLIEIELVIWKKCVGRGPFLSPTPGWNKGSNPPCQVELTLIRVAGGGVILPPSPSLQFTDLTIFCCYLVIWITFIFTCNVH